MASKMALTLHGSRATEYTVQDGVIVSQGKEEAYDPGQYRDLLWEFMRVQNEEDLLSFVKNYGLLGQRKVQSENIKGGHRWLVDLLRQKRQTDIPWLYEALAKAQDDKREVLSKGEDISWGLANARTVRFLYRGFLLLRRELKDPFERTEKFITFINEYNKAVQEITNMSTPPAMQEIEDQAKAPKNEDEAENYSNQLKDDVEFELFGTLEAALHGGIQIGINPPEELGKLPQPALVFETLIHFIYYRLVDLYTQTLILCPWCGEYFLKDHGHRTYCPDKHCNVSYRVEKHRVKQIAKELIASGRTLQDVIKIVVSEWKGSANIQAEMVREWLNHEWEQLLPSD